MKSATLAVCLAAALLAGCRTVPPHAGASTMAEPGGIYLAPDGAAVSFDGIMREVRGDRVVYLGEEHNNDFQHAFQARVVRAMYAQDPHVLIGMEMFQRPYQGALDRFIAGEIDERTFLRESEYMKRWRWDWHYYRDILLFAREKKIPVIALNSPAEVNRKVARGGGLKALTDEDRKWVAKDIDLGIKAHRDFVMKIFERHPMMPGFDKEAFYASQCVWEDTMAESVARALDAHPGHRMAVIVGGGHVRRGFGIPVRAERRGAKPYAILVGESLPPGHEVPAAELFEDDPGEAVFVTEPAPATPPSPKLGVMPEMKPGGPGLGIARVTPGSIADLAGMKAGDRLVALSGQKIDGLEDLQIALALFDGRMGTLTVLRGGEELTLDFDRAWALP